MTALVATLAVTVVPLLLVYPNALGTIWRYLSAPTFPLGYGPSVLILQRLIKPLPSDLFLGASATAMALTLLWGLARVGGSVRGYSASACFWLSWRSLDEYMAQVPLLALVAILALLAKHAPGRGPEGQPQLPANSGDATGNLVQHGSSASA